MSLAAIAYCPPRTASSSIKLQLIPDVFVARRLDDEIALFNTNSGQTHVLGPELSVVFDLLTESPKSRNDLVADLMSSGDFFQDDTEIFIDRALLQLHDIGLIDSVDQS